MYNWVMLSVHPFRSWADDKYGQTERVIPRPPLNLV